MKHVSFFKKIISTKGWKLCWVLAMLLLVGAVGNKAMAQMGDEYVTVYDVTKGQDVNVKVGCGVPGQACPDGGGGIYYTRLDGTGQDYYSAKNYFYSIGTPTGNGSTYGSGGSAINITSLTYLSGGQVQVGYSNGSSQTVAGTFNGQDNAAAAAAAFAVGQANWASQQQWAQQQMATAASQGDWTTYNYYAYYGYYLAAVSSGAVSGGNGVTNTFPTITTSVSPAPANTDSMPNKVNCSDTANANGQKLTQILNGIESSPEMRDFRDSSKLRTNEVGMSIQSPSPNVYTPFNYVKNGTSSTVATTTAAPAIATLHLHTASTPGHKHVDGPSPQDLYKILSGWQGNPNNKIGYQISADSPYHEFAVMVTDSISATSFLALNSRDSTINLTTHGWAGDINDPNTLLGQYAKAVNKYYSEGYGRNNAFDFGTVYMMSKLNMGIKMYIKENGSFKELNYYTDTNNNSLYKIKICQ